MSQNGPLLKKSPTEIIIKGCNFDPNAELQFTEVSKKDITQPETALYQIGFRCVKDIQK